MGLINICLWSKNFGKAQEEEEEEEEEEERDVYNRSENQEGLRIIK